MVLPLLGSPSSRPSFVPKCAVEPSHPVNRSLLDCYIAASFLAHTPWLPWQRKLQQALFGLDGKSSGAVARVASAAAMQRAALSHEGRRVTRWHAVTQDRLFGLLRKLWADDRPRVMLDLGCHAGAGRAFNVSDANIWLNHFNHTGSEVLGVDAFEDFALDLAARFRRAAYVGVRARAVQYALSHEDL